MKVFLISIFLLTSLVHSQRLEGVIYDAESSIEGAKFTNIRTKEITYSDAQGHFTMAARPNDTISISSYFHIPHKFLVQPNHFESKIVIELKKVLNELDEVDVVSLNKMEFEKEAIENTTESQLSEDIKKNPHLYDTSSEYGLDFIRLGALVANLFKSNKKIRESSPINYQDYLKLFQNNSLFSETLLSNDFKIPPNKKMLFLEYCENKKFDSNLLRENQQLVLLDSMYNASLEFNKLLDATQQED